MIKQLNTSPNLHNEKGVIDLASVLVGVIVIGLIGGLISATVFTVIPWTQDKAAKQQLDSINVAQAAYKAKASDPTTATEGFVTNSYADSAALNLTGLLIPGANYCTTTTGDGYVAYSRSATGKVFTSTDKNTAPKEHTVTPQDANLPGCEFLRESLSDKDEDNGEGTPPTDDNGEDDGGGIPPEEGGTPPIDGSTPPKDNMTIITYRCDVKSEGALPIRDIYEGRLTVEGSDNTKIEEDYFGDAWTNIFIFNAGVEYKVTFEGTYESFTHEYGTVSPKCVRSLDYWGEKTDVYYAGGAFNGASNLTSVPDSIPSSVANLNEFFKGATNFNDPNVSKWNVSRVGMMKGMFNGATSFNQPLNGWDVTNVSDVTSMFAGATAFKQDISGWNFKLMPKRTGFQNAGFPTSYLPKQFQ